MFQSLLSHLHKLLNAHLPVDFKTYTLCGTPEYIAPEVLLNKGHGKGVDWWTLGILIYEMLVGDPPFLSDDPMEIYQQILNGKVKYTRSYDKYAKSLTKRILTADLTKRYGWKVRVSIVLSCEFMVSI